MINLLKLMHGCCAPDAGTLVNTTQNYVNAYDGTTQAFAAPNDLSSLMKTYYDTELLENARPNLIHAQFARKQPLPKGRGKKVEWRKFNTLADASALTEGVIPTGQKFGQSSMTASILQYGTYLTVSDQLELHALDNVILGATEELGASAGTSIDKRVRDTIVAGSNVQYCDKVSSAGAHTAVTGRSGLDKTALLTPDEVRMLDNQYAILFIRGERPVLDFKYDILKHPNVAMTADGNAGVYTHGEVKSDVATIELISFDKNKAPEIEVAETNYELLSDEDFDTN